MPYTGCMDKTARTKQKIERAFWDLYARKPVERISVREITEAAGFARGTFYLHYLDIYDLLDQAEQALLDDMERCIDRCPSNPGKTDLIGLMTRLLTLYERNRTQIVLLLGDRGDAAFRRKLKDQMKRMPIWKAHDPALDLSTGERDLMLGQTASGVISLISDWLEDQRGVSATELLHLIYESAIKRG